MPTVAPVLQIQNLRIAARSGFVALEDFSLTIQASEFVALVGESGSGKTMAARAILRLLPPGMQQNGGSIKFNGTDIARLSPAGLRAIRGGEIGMVFQEPMASLNPALTIGDQLREGLRLHRALPREEVRQLCLDMLRRVQIRDPEHCLAAFPHEFSGGMRQRIMLASVLLLKPRLLIADEPTTALDTISQREILDMMVELARDFGTAVLLITHNLGLVSRYAQRAAVLERGKIVEEGAAQQLLTAPSHPYTRRLIASLPQRRKAPPRETGGAAILSARSLCVEFSRRGSGLSAKPTTRAVDGVDMDIHPGETVALVGGSGSGKTTLGRALLGLVPAQAGRILYKNAVLDTRDTVACKAFRLGCQLVFQDPYSSLDPRMRVGKILEEPLLQLSRMDAKARKARVAETLADVGLAGYENRYPHALSGGQRQRIAIARAIIRKPELIVADEPVSALDVTIQMQILLLFEKLQRQYGFACLFISHDLAVVEHVADRVIVMQAGAIVETGNRDAVLDHPRHAYTRSLLAAAPLLDPVRPAV